MVYGRNQYDQKGILSILIERDEKDEPNTFMDLMNIQEWNYEK